MPFARLLLSVLIASQAAALTLPESLRIPQRVGRDVEAAARRRQYSEAQWRTLRRGEVITAETRSASTGSADERSVHAAAIVPAPPEEVWTVLADFEARSDFLPGAKEIRIEQVDGNRVWLSERLKFLLVTIRYRVINTLDPERGRMAWILDKSVANDIADTAGAWQLTAIEDVPHTLVTYQAWIDTGQPVPQLLEGFLLKRSLPQLIEGLRDEVRRRAADR